jgi:hypothetical protein
MFLSRKAIEKFIIVIMLIIVMANTTIAVSMKVKEQIKEYGNKGETYDEILSRILDSAHERRLRDILMDPKDCVTIEEAREKLKKLYGKSNNR